MSGPIQIAPSILSADFATLGEQIAACYAKAYGNEPFVRLLEGKALPGVDALTNK